MQHDIQIERARESHADGVCALYNAPEVARQLLELPYRGVEQWRRQLLHEDERQLALVALHGAEVVGVGSLGSQARVRRAHVGGIALAVRPDWHGRGVGTRLLSALLDVADRWMQLHRLELTVYADNTAAVALYQRHGFEVEGELRDYAMRDGGFVSAYSMARLRQSGIALNAPDSIAMDA
ncbi:GNAT family N-acetyltransferase [Xanthomonas hydrangeae]|uniref:GNAT family N-acetyltransferase n=1 Tax=Xanthomonas hydrangeae TaxID=2775159 RepID=A0AAU0BBR2_9XANT|nr:GNAT family N-acetyltransferase [Xanthomonas hydrangeae]WOB49458.1 GNAT family N-acetyltransferase [Xanthomonas hydrangeae]